MKVSEAIKTIDEIYPNDCSFDKKYLWLRKLDEKVKIEVFDTHEDAPDTPEIVKVPVITLSSCCENSEAFDYSVLKEFIINGNTVKIIEIDAEGKILRMCPEPVFSKGDKLYLDAKLAINEPYDEAYIHYLEYKLHYFYHEIDRYNDAVVKFSDEYSDFKSMYNRTHMPKQSTRKYY